MSHVRERFRNVLARSTCTLAANISTFVGPHRPPAGVRRLRAVGFGREGGESWRPDIVLSNMSDVVDHCRRITRMADVSLMVDAEDGFGNAVNVIRTVKELEAAGVSAIEIEDNVVPKQFNVPHPGLVSKAEQVGKLKAAVAARSDSTTVIVARTSALAECSLDEAWIVSGPTPTREPRP